MATAPTDFTQTGLSAVAAEALATNIDGTPSAPDLTGVGFAGPVADELVTQITAKTGNATNLMGLGVPAALAVAIDAAVDAIP